MKRVCSVHVFDLLAIAMLLLIPHFLVACGGAPSKKTAAEPAVGRKTSEAPGDDSSEDSDKEDLEAVDLENLSDAQLSNIARTVRQLETAKPSDRVREVRDSLLVFFQDTPQVPVDLCQGYLSSLSLPSSGGGISLQKQFLLSLGAARIESGQTTMNERAHRSALGGVLRLAIATSIELPAALAALWDAHRSSVRAAEVEAFSTALFARECAEFADKEELSPALPSATPEG